MIAMAHKRNRQEMRPRQRHALRRRPGCARGFSLLEVLVAIALVLALVGAMFWFLHDMMAGRDRINEELGRRQAASLLIDRLEQDLLTCIAGNGRASGIRGTETELAVLTRAVPARLAGQGRATASTSSTFGDDESAESSAAPDSRPGLGAGASSQALKDLEQAIYRYNASNGTIAIGRGLPASTAGRSAAIGVQPTTLPGVVGAVRFRYYDGSRWRERYDSVRDGGLPVAIEVAVWYEPVEDAEGFAEGFAPPPEPEMTEEPDADVLNDPEAFDAWMQGLDEEPVSREPPARPARTPDRVRIIAIIDPSGEEQSVGEESAEDAVESASAVSPSSSASSGGGAS